MSEKMCITVVEVDEKFLFEGAFVMNRSGMIKQIFLIPQGKTISECVKDGSFDLNRHVDYDTVMLNKSRFRLVPEEYVEMIGKRVCKQKSGKPFKSGKKINTVKEIVKHIQCPEDWAFTFEEDDSYVKCKICKLVEDEQ